MELANFFWHGNFTKLEKSCIKSFVDNGFEVRLWSYTNLSVDGAISMDARLILPESDLHKYNQLSDHTDGFIASISTFSDVFRYTVLNKFGGWWFDTDCYCLKSANEYSVLRQNKPIIAGWEDSNSIACGVLYLNKSLSENLIKEVEVICHNNNNQFDRWGMIGPLLTTDFIRRYNLYDNIVQTKLFYPIHYDDIKFIINSEYKQHAKSLLKDSYLIHLWDSMLVSKYNIDKNNPPNNSLLEELINEQ